MKPLKTICLSLFCFSLPLSAQIKVFYKDSGEPVKFALASDKQGRLIGITDNDGYITRDVKENKEIILRNLSCHPVTVTSQQIKDNRIALLPDTESPVEVYGKDETSEYLRIKGNFECVQFQDSVLTYEKKGIVEYLVPLKKGKIKKRIISLDRKQGLSPASYEDVCDVPELERKLLINHPLLNREQSQKIEMKEKGQSISTLIYQPSVNTCYLELGSDIINKDIRMLAVRTNLRKSVYAQRYSCYKNRDEGIYELENLSGMYFLHVVLQKVRKREFLITLSQNVWFTEIEYLSKQEVKQWKKQ